MYLRVSELIERVYVETGLREQVSSLPDGSSRVLALETFREWANAYENGRNGGLYRFVTYVEDIRSRQESPEEFALAASDSDAVHCMYPCPWRIFRYILPGIRKTPAVLP